MTGKIKVSIIFITFLSIWGCDSNKNPIIQEEEIINPEGAFDGTFTVLSLNAWQEGTKVNGGFEAIVDFIVQSEADIVMLCEVRNYDNTVFSSRIVIELDSRGHEYRSFNSGKSAIILSKFPITTSPGVDINALTKCLIKLDESTSIAMYGAHLDYTHYACYLPRGYDGITWKQLPAPITDVSKILEQNLASQRDEAIGLFVEDAMTERENGNIVIFSGDFNEPSHLDWTIETKDMYDHNGTVVPWHNSITLQQNNYLDAYRVKYPNPVTHPGHTWAAFNTDVALNSLVWTPEADDRDRIDFIYYNDDSGLTVEDIIIAGPSGSVVRGEGYEDMTAEDKFLTPHGKWPSDHKGVLATFKLEL